MAQRVGIGEAGFIISGLPYSSSDAKTSASGENNRKLA